MNRRDVLLAILGSAQGQQFSPVQLQKAAFLIQRNAPHLFDAGAGFNFIPYDYGPFDKAVYDEASRLSLADLARIEATPHGGYRQYSASEEGQAIANNILAALPANDAEYVQKVSDWVRSLSFTRLVKSIYEAYPEMRANSVFVD